MRSKNFNTLLLILIILIYAGTGAFSRQMRIISPTGNNDYTEYTYKLRFLKNAAPPRQTRLINTGNVGKKGRNLISDGVLFTYKNRKASTVRIAGNFSLWKPVFMERSENGVWYYFLEAGESDTDHLSYKFLVDSVWIPDPMNTEKTDDGTGSFISLAAGNRRSFSKNISYKIVGKNLVEFRIYRPDARFISLVGDFNSWNPENDILSKGKDGIWRLKKHLPAGSYLYRYIIDGKWVQDIFNPLSASDISGDLCSVIELN